MSAPRILIADDDPGVLAALSTRCKKMGFEVDTAHNGMQMLLKARRTAPDLMIVDVNMPKLDGLTASCHLLEPGGPPMDVIVVSGISSEETLERCEALGMFYACKQAEFWRDISKALTEIFPHMAATIAAQAGPMAGAPDVVPSRPRVLIVDDDEEIGIFLTSRLKKIGIEVLYASNAGRALRLAVWHYPSLIVTDFSMPDGDAGLLLSRLRSYPATAAIPVVVLSGKDIDEPTSKMLKREVMGHAGAIKIVKKSFDVSELFDTIQEYCSAEPSAVVGR
ncbi:response regulator receiver domain protein [Rhodopseudomonas palustris HaA2]|uniref:Response regulator receiver domain protein n=1 Tax=Rhodopseudomonas palustris (strain HaA2) TaxID=316058 RepID=Q2IT01_RHOP2|nr:response regulator [Rhodopseudomonas palustris]ABD08659.1 response regulator receiver domain protein [Rhodopseudomonas palustris HaA2]